MKACQSGTKERKTHSIKNKKENINKYKRELEFKFWFN